MNSEWKNYIRSNLPELLRDIDTSSGLEGEMRQKLVLPPMLVKRIWSVKDEIRRVSDLLDHIQKGDKERFDKFCSALIASQQEHIVDRYLTKCVAKDSTDAAPAAPYPLENPLSKEVQRKLCESWNELIEKLDSRVEFLDVLASSKVFTDLQIRRLKALEMEVERNEQILRYLEKTSQEKFQRFCDALHSTDQGHVVGIIYNSQAEGNRTMNEVVDKTTKLSVEEATQYAARAPQPACRSMEQSECTNTSQPANICHPDPDDAAMKSVFSLCPSATFRCTLQNTNGEGDPQRGTSVEEQPGQLGRPSPDLIRRWREDVEAHKAYDIFYDDGSQKKRGVALIVANTDFSQSSQRLETRTGTNVDIKMLKKMLEYLKFDVHEHCNLTEQQILEKCRTESDTMLRDATIFCFFILSHGVTDAVYGVDGKLVKIEDIVTIFDGRNCRGLVGKPKILFIQACQGDSRTMGVDKSDLGGVRSTDESDGDTVRHEKADIMQVLASYPGFVSYRNTETGSYFIQFICDVFRKNAHEKPVRDMIDMVKQQLNAARMDGCFIQTLQVRDTTDKPIYLFPY